MRATANTIWRVPAYLPYLQPPLTAEMVAATENELGYKLPDDYLGLLKEQNGGYIRFSLPQLPHDTIAGIGPHFPSLVLPDWEDCQEHVSFLLSGLVPFDGDGHWHLCLDYRQNEEAPSITYADIECDRESRVADSFGAYLTLLQIDPGNNYVLESIPDIGKITSDLSSALGITFDPPDTWAHGYPTHRARFGISSKPEWIWISPNTVPRGFVRSDDRRYAVLKDLLPGDAPRFPGLPPDSYILGATDGVRSKVLEACRREKWKVRPLREYLHGS